MTENTYTDIAGLQPGEKKVLRCISKKIEQVEVGIPN
jgi:hypothetical protein